MARKKTDWGQPGETGIGRDGVPWYVPEEGPGRGLRFFLWLFPMGRTKEGMPPGARYVEASTAAEAQERCMRKYGDGIRKLLDQDEELHGFTQFLMDENVPMPPQNQIEAKVGPNPLKHWWMGGDWNTMAGELVAKNGSRYRDINGTGIMSKALLLIRTDRRILIWGGSMERPMDFLAEYDLGQIGLRPGWRPDDPANGDRSRVDVAFTDGSWLGLFATTNAMTPGGAETNVDRDWFAELVGPPVTADALPARGRG